MPSKIVDGILEQQGGIDTFTYLSQQLSGTELNSLLLEVMNQRAAQLQASDIARQYGDNRFVQPTDLDPIALGEYGLSLLKHLRQQGFETFQSSPLSPLGTCSVLGPVDQRNVVSALRQTEIVADVTNVMALEVAQRRKEGLRTDLRLCASHRHVRAQQFDIPGFTPHFQVLALASAGRDRGNYRFEIEAIVEHVQAYTNLLQDVLDIPPSALRFRGQALYDGNESYLITAFEKITAQLSVKSLTLEQIPQADNQYYRGFRFKINWQRGDDTLEIIDGGAVDWTQQLTSNRKERFLISGLGAEFLYRMRFNS